MSARIHIRHGALDDEIAAEVRHLAELAGRHDGVEPLGEQTLLDLAAGHADHVLAEDGQLVGYGQLGPSRGGTRTAELVVAPSARGSGLGGRVLTSLLGHAGASGDANDGGASGDTSDGAPATQIRLWAHGSLPAASVLARRAHLTPVRELWRMARDLTPPEHDRAESVSPTTSPPTSHLPNPSLPTPSPPTTSPAAVPLPAGVQLRAFEPGRDEAAWLDINAAAFAHHPEQGTMTAADLAAREAEPWFEPGDLLLAERDGALLGFAWTKVAAAEGELYVLGVAPGAQGQGLGRALTAAALEHLRHRGATRAILFTDAGNAPAVRTYTAAGFVVDRADTQFAPAQT